MRGRSGGPRDLVLAGVDIGTLTCRLLIAEVSAEGQIRKELASDRRILRLGQGWQAQRLLQDGPMARVLATLKEWRGRVEEFATDGCLGVATSAVREAQNGRAFLTRVQQETGFTVEVLSGQEEARRTMLGIRSGLPAEVSSILGLDIGGGSTEFILDRPPAMPVTRSVEIGVVRLTEALLEDDPPTVPAVQAAREAIRRQVQPIRESLGPLAETTLVGAAGTITTLAAMAQRLTQYDRGRIHNYRLSLETIRDIERALLSRRRAERLALPGLEPGREDVIVAGTLILDEVMEVFGYQKSLVSDLGLREGVLIEYAQRLNRRQT